MFEYAQYFLHGLEPLMVAKQSGRDWGSGALEFRLLNLVMDQVCMLKVTIFGS